MTDRPDPKEVKLLADILALVLEDQPGQSTTALDTIRRRAHASRVTGGALKNLFLRLTVGALEADAEREHGRLRSANQAMERDLAAAKFEVVGLQGERYRLQRQVADIQTLHDEAVDQQRTNLRVGAICGALGMAGLVTLGLVAHALWLSPQPRPTASVSTPPAAATSATALAGAQPPRPAASTPPMRLSDDARRAIGAHVQSCWAASGATVRPNTVSFDIQVQIDETGTIRAAHLTGEDQAAQNDPSFAAFADHALQALLSPQCATLPLPTTMLGHRQALDFHFSP